MTQTITATDVDQHLTDWQRETDWRPICNGMIRGGHCIAAAAVRHTYSDGDIEHYCPDCIGRQRQLADKLGWPIIDHRAA